MQLLRWILSNTGERQWLSDWDFHSWSAHILHMFSLTLSWVSYDTKHSVTFQLLYILLFYTFSIFMQCMGVNMNENICPFRNKRNYDTPPEPGDNINLITTSACILDDNKFIQITHMRKKRIELLYIAKTLAIEP